MKVQETEAQYCAKILRHAAMGGVLGGPVAVWIGWRLYERSAWAQDDAPRDDTGSLVVALMVGVLFVGVWIGATVACWLGRHESGEEVCYGGAFGCLVYIVGGVLGALVGSRLPQVGLHPVAWYLIGGTVLALVGLALAVLSPASRCRVRRPGEAPEGDDGDGPQSWPPELP